MEFSLAKRNKVIAFFACILISFLIGYVHHAYFFPLLFHGDAAALHVLAKAMIEEGCFLPKDFAYGTDEYGPALNKSELQCLKKLSED